MTASLIVSALCLLLVGMFVGVRAVRAARERHWLGGTIRGLVAMLLPALAALAATLTVGLHGYRALSFEEVAETLRPGLRHSRHASRPPACSRGRCRAGRLRSGALGCFRRHHESPPPDVRE